MRNLLLLLLLANVLYFLWGWTTDKATESGVNVTARADLGSPLQLVKKPEAPKREEAIAARPANVVESDFCASIGPFSSSPDAQNVFQELRTEGMRAAVRSTAGELFVGHWVQIQNITDRPTADAMIEKLIGSGLTDAYLVPAEDENLRISLGLFGEISRAERVESQAKALDLPAEIVPRMRDGTVFFVDAALPQGRGASAMIDRFGEERVRLQANASCPGRI